MVYNQKIFIDSTAYARATVNYADCEQQKIVKNITRQVFHVVNEVSNYLEVEVNVIEGEVCLGFRSENFVLEIVTNEISACLLELVFF